MHGSASKDGLSTSFATFGLAACYFAAFCFATPWYCHKGVSALLLLALPQ